MAKLNKDRLIFGVFLIIVIALAEIILGHLKFPAWPAFMVMIFFFEVHMDIKKAANILVGCLFGIANLILIKIFLGAAAASLGLELATLVYVIVFVYLIVALGELVPVIFNNYAFMAFLVAAVAANAPAPNVLVWMGVELVGGAIFIAAILGIVKIMGFWAAKKAS
ncbi:MAG: hypothetical protein ACLP9S_16815 [Syntrophales bacterium]|jgi:hypothetical protein